MQRVSNSFAGTTSPPAHSVVGEMAFALLGVSAFAIVADASPGVGKVLLVIMIGFVGIWFMIHATGFSQILTKLQSVGS